MLVGAVITSLIGIGVTVGGAALGAEYSSPQHKTAGAALGAAGGILASGVISAIYIAAVADTFVQEKKLETGIKNMTAGGQVKGLPAKQQDPVMQRLATVGPFVVPMGG